MKTKGTAKMSAEIKGFKELQKALSTEEPFFVEPWKEALEHGAKQVVKLGQKRSPVLSGKLRDSIKYKMDPRKVPMWARVTANKTTKSARYGYMLNYSRKVEYHFRSGPTAGAKTLWWFSYVKKDLAPVLNMLITQTADGLLTAWRARGGH